jgi:hypothetical protein
MWTGGALCPGSGSLARCFFGIQANGEGGAVPIERLAFKSTERWQRLIGKYPQAFFGGMVAMTKVIRWETAMDAGGFDHTMTPDEIMDRLEDLKAGKLFEQFLRKVNKLQAQQQLEAQAQIGRPGPQIARR